MFFLFGDCVFYNFDYSVYLAIRLLVISFLENFFDDDNGLSLSCTSINYIYIYALIYLIFITNLTNYLIIVNDNFFYSQL